LFKLSIYNSPFILLSLVNRIVFANIIINTKCFIYRICNSHFAQKYNLIYIKVNLLYIKGFNGKIKIKIDEIVVVDLDFDGIKQERVFIYIIPLLEEDTILRIL
jgi:hypothetical protein